LPAAARLSGHPNVNFLNARLASLTVSDLSAAHPATT